MKNDGEITQEISFPTQIEEMDLAEEKKDEYIKKLTLEIKSKLFFPYFVNFYTISVVKGVEEYNIGGEKMSYSLPSYDEKTNCINFIFTFADMETWNYYHDNGDEDKGLNVQKGFFINLGKSKSEFLFSQTGVFEDKEQTLGEYFLTMLKSVQKEFCNTEISKPELAYVYQQSSNKLHTNADEKFEQNEMYTSVWHSSSENLQNAKDVEIFVYSPNRAVWYLSAIGCTFLIMFVATLVQKARNGLRKEKNF